MTILISMLTLGTGRTNILFGLVHMLVFAVCSCSWCSRREHSPPIGSLS